MTNKPSERWDGRAAAPSDATLETIVDTVLAANPDAVAGHRLGRPTIGFLLGKVMQASGGTADAAAVQEALRARLGDPERDPAPGFAGRLTNTPP